jgi:hypothetical protein
MFISVILFCNSNMSTSNPILLKQISLTSLDEILDLTGRSICDDFSVKLPSHTGNINDGMFTEDKLISYIAPSFSFTVFSEEENKISHVHYIFITIALLH